MTITQELCPTPMGRKRWSRDDCDFLERAGLLAGNYELIDGEIISKMGQNPPHAITVMRVIAFLLRLFQTDCIRTQATTEVRKDDQVTNRPEPDVALLREALGTVPDGSDILLAVEVSDTTQADDFGYKVGLYARAGVQEYWVLDIPRRLLVAFRQPQGGNWQARAEYGENDTVACDAAPNSPLRVGDLLPQNSMDNVC